MDNFNEEITNILGPDMAPSQEETKETNEKEAIPVVPPVAPGFKLAGDGGNVASDLGQSMGETAQTAFGQPVGEAAQPMFGQATGGAGQPMFGQTAAPSQQPMFGQTAAPGQQPMFGQPAAPGQQPMFGQPAAPGQQPMFGQPAVPGQTMFAQNMPPQGGKPPKKAKKPKKPLSKGAIAGIIGGGVGVVGLIVAGILIIPKFFRSDKEVIVDAFESTFGITVDAEEDVLGTQEIVDKYYTTGGSNEFGIEFSENITGEDVVAGVKYAETLDVNNKRVNSNLDITYNGSDLLSANMIIDENDIYVQVPELINGYFTLPSQNTLQALENSPIGEAMEIEGMPAFNVTDLYFNVASAGGATDINTEYVKIIEKLWSSITYEKDGKEKVEVNGETIKATKYVITLSEDSAKEAIGGIWDVTVDEMTSNPAYVSEMGMDAATFESQADDVKNMLIAMIKGDLVIDVYIVDDKIVKLVCADEVKIYGVALDYNMYMDISEDKASGLAEFSVSGETVGMKFEADSINENPTGKISVYAAGETIDMNFKTENTESGTKKTCDFTLDVVYDGEKCFDLSFISNYDSSSHAIDGEYAMTVPEDGELKFTYEGQIKDITKGVAYTIELSDCELLINDESLMTFSAYTSLDTSKNTTSEPDASIPVYDVTTLSEDDFVDILTTNLSLIQNWSLEHSDLLDLGLDDYDDEDEYDYDEDEDDDEGYVDPTVEPDTMLLVGNNKSVEILGTIEGFDFSYYSEYFIDFESESYSYIEYSLEEWYTLEECLESIYTPAEGVITQEIAQSMEFDGETIYYSYVHEESFEIPASHYKFVRDLGDGTLLVVDVTIYEDEESYTKEQLVEAIGSQYFKVVE